MILNSDSVYLKNFFQETTQISGLAKASLVIFNTTPESPSRPMRLGMAMAPFIVSEKSHTKFTF